MLKCIRNFIPGQVIKAALPAYYYLRRFIPMATLKKIFPLAFKAKKDIGALIVNILVHALADIVAGLIIGLLPILGILGGVIGLYFTASVILSILDYLKVLK